MRKLAALVFILLAALALAVLLIVREGGCDRDPPPDDDDPVPACKPGDKCEVDVDPPAPPVLKGPAA